MSNDCTAMSEQQTPDLQQLGCQLAYDTTVSHVHLLTDGTHIHAQSGILMLLSYNEQR